MQWLLSCSTYLVSRNRYTFLSFKFLNAFFSCNLHLSSMYHFRHVRKSIQTLILSQGLWLYPNKWSWGKLSTSSWDLWVFSILCTRLLWSGCQSSRWLSFCFCVTNSWLSHVQSCNFTVSDLGDIRIFKTNNFFQSKLWKHTLRCMLTLSHMSTEELTNVS